MRNYVKDATDRQVLRDFVTELKDVEAHTLALCETIDELDNDTVIVAEIRAAARLAHAAYSNLGAAREHAKLVLETWPVGFDPNDHHWLDR